MRTCEECGGEIPPERNKAAKYCSPTCKARHSTRMFYRTHQSDILRKLRKPYKPKPQAAWKCDELCAHYIKGGECEIFIDREKIKDRCPVLVEVRG